jgi:Holliday junction resolvasome RuvABC endonuclease subunit
VFLLRFGTKGIKRLYENVRGVVKFSTEEQLLLRVKSIEKLLTEILKELKPKTVVVQAEEFKKKYGESFDELFKRRSG